MTRRIAISLFLLSASLSLSAQEADTLSAAAVSSTKHLPVSRAAEEVYLPSQPAAPRAVADVLSRFTGVQVKDYGGAGGLKTVNVRSLGSEHVGVFLDGIQVDNAQNMQVALGRFSTDGLVAVSLYTGQKSGRLQTAGEYASGAAVHLDSGRPLRDGGSVRISGGSLGTVNPSVRLDKSFGAVGLQTSAEFLASHGRYRYPYFDTTLVRENGDIRSLRLDAQLYGSQPKGEWRLRLYSFGSERGFPGPVIRRASGFPLSAERQADQDFFVQGSWTHDWTERYSTAVRAKYDNSYTHYATHPEKNPMALPYDLHYRRQSGYLSLAQSVSCGDVFALDLSADIQRSALDSDAGQFVTPRRTVFTGAFASRLTWERFRAAAHIAYTGAWDSFLTPAAGGWTRENAYRDAWMPSASLFYAPLKWLEVSAFARRSYRLPSFNDLYYSLMGNASLKPESAWQSGLDVRVAGAFVPWTFELRVAPYYNRIDDKIVAIPTSSQFRWTMLNIGKVDVYGLDARASGRYSSGGWTVDAVLRYSLQMALDHSTPGSLTWGNQIPYIPVHSAGAHAAVSWRRWALTWDTAITGERWSRSANTADYHIAPWSVTDVCASRSFGLTAGEVKASVRLSNLFNERYQIVQGYPMPGLCAYATVAYSW